MRQRPRSSPKLWVSPLHLSAFRRQKHLPLYLADEMSARSPEIRKVSSSVGLANGAEILFRCGGGGGRVRWRIEVPKSNGTSFFLSFFHPPYVHLLLLFLLQMSVCLCRGGGTFCILESKVVHSESSVFGNSWSLVSQTHYYILVKWRVYINTEGFETNCKKKHWHFSTRIANILSYFSCMQILLSA